MALDSTPEGQMTPAFAEGAEKYLINPELVLVGV
jgi:hypothetical protein